MNIQLSKRGGKEEYYGGEMGVSANQKCVEEISG